MNVLLPTQQQVEHVCPEFKDKKINWVPSAIDEKGVPVRYAAYPIPGAHEDYSVEYTVSTGAIKAFKDRWVCCMPKSYDWDSAFKTTAITGYPVTIIFCHYTGIPVILLYLSRLGDEYGWGWTSGSKLFCQDDPTWQLARSWCVEQKFLTLTEDACDKLTTHEFDSHQMQKRWEQWHEEGRWPEMQKLGIEFDNTPLDTTFALGTVFRSNALPITTAADVVKEIIEILQDNESTFSCDVCNNVPHMPLDQVWFCPNCIRTEIEDRWGRRQPHASNACINCVKISGKCPICLANSWIKGSSQIVQDKLKQTITEAFASHEIYLTHYLHSQNILYKLKRDLELWLTASNDQKDQLFKFAQNLLPEKPNQLNDIKKEIVVNKLPSAILLSLCTLAQSSRFFDATINSLPNLQTQQPPPRLLIINSQLNPRPRTTINHIRNTLPDSYKLICYN